MSINRRSPADDCAHKAAADEDVRRAADPNKQKRKYTQHAHTCMRAHTHAYTLSLHCRHNSQAWLCASLIPLTVSERHVNQRRRLPAQPYMSLSLLLSLLLSLCLSASIGAFSLQSETPFLLLYLVAFISVRPSPPVLAQAVIPSQQIMSFVFAPTF